MHDIDATSVVYIDTNIFIYFIEAAPDFFERTKALFGLIDTVGARLVASDLTLAECVYKPYRDNDPHLARAYESLFEASGEIDLVPLNGATIRRAAANGGGLGLKLLDAIHYVYALEAGCDVFVTTDRRFRSGPKMRVVYLND